jgi:hypothetical protein
VPAQNMRVHTEEARPASWPSPRRPLANFARSQCAAAARARPHRRPGVASTTDAALLERTRAGHCTDDGSSPPTPPRRRPTSNGIPPACGAWNAAPGADVGSGCGRRPGGDGAAMGPARPEGENGGVRLRADPCGGCRPTMSHPGGRFRGETGRLRCHTLFHEGRPVRRAEPTSSRPGALGQERSDISSFRFASDVDGVVGVCRVNSAEDNVPASSAEYGSGHAARSPGRASAAERHKIPQQCGGGRLEEGAQPASSDR